MIETSKELEQLCEKKESVILSIKQVQQSIEQCQLHLLELKKQEESYYYDAEMGVGNEFQQGLIPLTEQLIVENAKVLKAKESVLLRLEAEIQLQAQKDYRNQYNELNLEYFEFLDNLKLRYEEIELMLSELFADEKKTDMIKLGQLLKLPQSDQHSIYENLHIAENLIGISLNNKINLGQYKSDRFKNAVSSIDQSKNMLTKINNRIPEVV